MTSAGEWACAPAAALASMPLASCYVYAPGGAGGEAGRLLTSVKTGSVDMLLTEALRHGTAKQRADIVRFFPEAALLVPVPRCAPNGAVLASPAERLAQALLQIGLGRRVWPGLRRVKAVRKSATAPPGCRPSVREHFGTLQVDRPSFTGLGSIVLIDDVVSRGRTLFAAAIRVRERLPGVDLRAFALLRTVGIGGPVDGLPRPCIGRIEWRRHDAHRSP